MLSRDVLNALWPEGDFWTPLADDDYDLLLDGVADNSEDVRLDVNNIRYLRDPSRTPILDDLEREFAVVPVPGATEAERRSRLAVEMFRRGELPTYEMLQEKLRAAGFDVWVYPNSPAVDPAIFIEQAFQMMCGELLPSGNDAQCGEPEAYCGRIGGELLVNGDQYEQSPNYTILCDEALAQCGETDALCGQFDSIRLTLIEYSIPDDSGYWPLIFFVGGEAVYSDLTIRSIRFIAAPEANQWNDVAYGNGVWIGISPDGANRIMRSTDNGLTWTSIAAPEANLWNDVATDGAGVWCAVASDGVNQIMRSIDNGATWGSVAAPEANFWRNVATDGAGVWCAVSSNGINRIMRSINDGVVWGSVAAPEANNWNKVATDGAGVWCAVSLTGVNQIMRSIDNGATWGSVAAPEANQWYSLAFGNDLWIALSANGTNRIMRSSDGGATWESIYLNEASQWWGIGYGNDTFIGVAVLGNYRIVRINGVVFNAISSIDIAPIPIERRLEFRRIILQNKPMCSWSALVVVYQ